jgi:hypothetical protein
MSTIREEWNESQKLDGFKTHTTWRIGQQIKAQEVERDSFHAILKLVPEALQSEAIALWVKGTEAAGTESYNRWLLLSELNESDYVEAQEIVFEAWKKLITA